MSPERFQQIDELYQSARKAGVSGRAALLARADPELRREVELLLAQPTGGGILDQPVAMDDSTAVTVTELASGVCLGPYQIQHKLGEGGMGEVFRAIDTRLGRAVAIKTTREQFTSRFEREAHDFFAQSPQYLHIVRYRPQLPGEGIGGGRNHRPAVEAGPQTE
jgi:hypothetical protein